MSRGNVNVNLYDDSPHKPRNTKKKEVKEKTKIDLNILLVQFLLK